MTTWGPKAATMSAEERELYLRGVQWELDQGHCSRVECIDGIIIRGFNTRTMRRTIKVEWRDIPAWIGDKFRVLAADLRKFRTRYILRRKNPYWSI